MGPAWDEALSANRPVVLDVHTDPEVPPIPPHMQYGQVKAYLSALLKGDPGAVDMIRAAAKDFFAPWLGRKD